MTARLQKSLRKLDEDRRALLAELEQLRDEQLAAKPIAGKWSIIEIVEHLVLAEKDVLQGLPEPSQLIGRKRSLKDRILRWVVVLVLKMKIPVKTPSRTMVPSGRGSIAELRSEWDQHYEWLDSYVEGLAADGTEKAVFAHPIAGPLTPAQAIHLAGIHLRLHAGQIRRLQTLVR